MCGNLSNFRPIRTDWICTNGHWYDTVRDNVTMPYAAELINSAAQHPRARSYTAQEMAAGTNEVVAAICSNSDYHEYAPFITENSIAKKSLLSAAALFRETAYSF